MRILIVNPNTTESMTRKIGEAARAVAFPGTLIDAVNPDHGPPSIEGYYDEAFSVPGTLACMVKGEAEGHQGFVLACFDDSGLDACRAAVAPPVVGLCEAAMQTASLIAHSFSVVTTLPRAIPVIEALGFRYGMERRLRGHGRPDRLAQPRDRGAGPRRGRLCGQTGRGADRARPDDEQGRRLRRPACQALQGHVQRGWALAPAIAG